MPKLNVLVGRDSFGTGGGGGGVLADAIADCMSAGVNCIKGVVSKLKFET